MKKLKSLLAVLAVLSVGTMSIPVSALELNTPESGILAQEKDVTGMFKESGWDKCVVYSDETIAVSSYIPSTSETVVAVPENFSFVSGTVTQIGYDSEPAIINADAVTAVVIPDTIQIIGDNAFSACPNLKDVYYIGTEDQWNAIAIGSGNDNLLNAEIHYNFTGEDLFSFTYSVLDDGGIEITKYTQYFPYGNINIPSEIDGYPVTSIGSSAFAYCYDLTSVTIPDGVTSIGDNAFSYCYDLKSITIPNSVTSIGRGVFFDCNDLTSITIPDSMTSIGDSAFAECDGLTSIIIPDNVTNIGDNAFSSCTGLTSVTILDSVTNIGKQVFSGCSSLLSIDVSENNLTYSSEDGILFSKDKTELLRYPAGISGAYTIPNNVTSIKNFAFSGCTGLTSVTIPNSIISIEKSAFSGCIGLTSVTIPDSVTSIEDSTFFQCTGLTSVTIPDSVTSIENAAFSSCTGLTSIMIPDSVTDINDDFSGCSSLLSIDVSENNPTYSSEGGILFSKDKTELLQYPVGISGAYTVPDGVTNIGEWAFSGCTGLTSITISDSVTSIDDFAFSGCDGLTSVTIPDSVTSIEAAAFSGCDSLTSITIPNSVENIGGNAFSSCTGLTSITIENPDCKIDSSVYTISNGLDDNYHTYYDGTIYGYADSTAQAYAERYGYKFAIIGTEPEETTTTTEETTTTTTTSTTTETTTTEKATTETTTSTTEETTTTTEETTTTTEETTTETSSTVLETTTEETTTTQVPYASDKDFCDWAAKDYKQKTGTAPAKTSATTDNGKTVITLTDENGEILDTYTIDPVTGKGTSSNGAEVNLPQTGITSKATASTAAAAVAVTAAGIALMGVSRKRKED